MSEGTKDWSQSPLVKIIVIILTIVAIIINIHLLYHLLTMPLETGLGLKYH